MTIDAVIFDWGGTLTPWHTIDVSECWLAVVGDEQQAAALRRAEDAVWVAARDEHRSGHLEQVIADAGLSLTPAQRRAYYEWWEQHTYTDADVAPTLTALRERGIRVGVLSNTIWPRVEHERIFDRDGVLGLIDGAVYSSEIAWTKPHPQAFEAALDAVGVTDPARAVFVGDRLFDDIFGAKQAGLRAVHIPHSDIPHWQTTGVEGTPDAVVHRLGELIALVDDWRRPG